MTDISYGYSKYKKIDVLEKKVLLRKLKNDDLKCEDGIYIPKSEKYKNETIGLGEVLGIGDETAKETGINVGDYVMYDYYSAHGDWEENVITNSENILIKMSKEEAYEFLKGSLKV